MSHSINPQIVQEKVSKKTKNETSPKEVSVDFLIENYRKVVGFLEDCDKEALDGINTEEADQLKKTCTCEKCMGEMFSNLLKKPIKLE